MIISIVCILFLLLNSVSAVDLSNATDDSNLLQNNNKIAFSTQNLEVSSNDSISETNLVNSRDDNLNNHLSDNVLYYNNSNEDDDFLGAQHFSEDSIQANEIKSTSLVGNDTELYFKNGSSYKVFLSDTDGNPLVNQSVIFSINGNNYTRTTNSNGIAVMRINLNSGNYNFLVSYLGTSVYGSSSTNNIVKVLPTISGDDVEKYFKNNTQYYATFVNGQGNLLINATVTFNINGVYYERKTNANGIARLNINLNSGEYIITAINPINGEMYSNNITVLPTIYAFDIEKYYKNNTQYYATFVNATGGYLVNKNVTFNINGVYYTRTTNTNGTARLNINLNPGKYIITVTNPTNGEMHSNNIVVLPTIFGNDLNMIYRNGSRYMVNVIDGKGNPLVNSTVTFNINGVLYNRISHDNGNAYLNINLDVGKYIITATNDKGLSISNIININKSNSIILGNNSHIITGTDKNFTVKLMGLNNKTINSATVHFTYNNKNVNAITNQNGEATIILDNLSEGKYDIKYNFEGNLNYYASQSNNTLIVANSTVILEASDLNMVYMDGSYFKATLKDLNGKPIVNDTILFVVNGVTYNRTTNDNGVAVLSIKLNPGTYTISYTHSNQDSPDYNEGSNTIIVSKKTAVLSANNLFIDVGDKATFDVLLTDDSNSPIKNMAVTFNINNVSYNRATNDSGIAKLNIKLGVGYYPIKISLDNLFYSAKSLSRNILVNGTLFVANDLNMIVGTTSKFSVTLNNAYGNPVSNANIKFTYSNISTTTKTNSEGIASISISNLVKGNYPVIYNYTDGNNVGSSYIHVVGTIKISSLIDAASYVNSYIEANSKLPDSVSIGGVSYSTAKYLYLLSEAIVNINNNDLSDLYVLNINNPTNPGKANDLGNLNNYNSVAKSLITSMDNGTTPNSVSTTIGTIGYDALVYAFTRVIVYYGEMNKLPSYVVIKSLDIYESNSVLDSANSIKDLSAYLASSRNCDVTNSQIVALSEKLTAGLTSSLEKATAIYNYVRDEISYSFYYDTKHGSVGTLSAGSGNCVDQAHLLIALYRAANLPARYVHGTCVFSSGNTYGHVWSQVLIGDTWVVSDPTSSRNSFGKVVNWNNYNYSLKGYYSSIYF